MIEKMRNILIQLKLNNLKVIEDVETCTMITYEALRLINFNAWDDDDIELADLIIKISNIAYNNTSCTILPLDDGVYDQLMVLYQKYNPKFQVGAPPMIFEERPQNEIMDEKVMCVAVDDMDSKLYIRDIWKQQTPLRYMRPVNMCFIAREPITKRLINTEHKYPELVGTLDKCKFVLNHDAVEADVYNNPAVQIFERDYMHKCLQSGIISPTEEFEMIGELKYDGVSIEAEVCGDTIISALSRGDTADNIATDLTPIFGGFKFHRAAEVPKDITFGIKFEAVITYYHLDRLSQIRQKSYKNCRNAIIGILGAGDAYKFIDYITLIPLSTSLDIDRIDELNFLNKYYNSGEYNRFCIFRGDYKSILFQIKQFTESAEEVRKILPYMVDGVVISFTDSNKIKTLGRDNSVNKYQMAIKFNPRSARTLFLGYTYSIGKSGDVIPMVHFKPCEFIGGIHTKQTIHSYNRFKELNLAKGEEINIDYVNDVITYITKPDTQYNRDLNAEPEKFIEECPFCGSKIEISPSGKSAKCPNINCHERAIMRMVDMIDRLGFKDFSEETVRLLDLTSFAKLINLTEEQTNALGPINSSNLLTAINRLKTEEFPDYRIMSAFSFDGMADATWKIVLSEYKLSELMNPEFDFSVLTKLSGIGEKTVRSIIDGLEYYQADIMYILTNMKILDSKGMKTGPKIILTGFRDPEYIKLLVDHGFDASDKYSMTKDAVALITTDKNSTSTKMQKAIKYGIPIYTKDEFLQVNNIVLHEVQT